MPSQWPLDDEAKLCSSFSVYIPRRRPSENVSDSNEEIKLFTRT